MRGRKVVVLAVGVAGVLALLLFPPFFGIDVASEGRRHASLGHHAVWAEPAPAQVFRALVADDAPLPSRARLADYQARVNRVRLFAEAVAIALATGAVARWAGGPRHS